MLWKWRKGVLVICFDDLGEEIVGRIVVSLKGVLA